MYELSLIPGIKGLKTLRSFSTLILYFLITIDILQGLEYVLELIS